MLGPTANIVIVGASLAGLKSAETLRRLGFGGRVVLVGAEDRLPYDRPPLSKAALTGEMALDEVAFRAAEEYVSLDLDLMLGTQASGLDLGARRVLVGEESIPYDGLIIATGTRARTLGVGSPPGTHVLRTYDDSYAIRKAFAAGPRVVVVGAGVIGCEVAASARSIGLEVTLVEPLKVPTVRAFGEAIGERVATLHRNHGVAMCLGTGVTGFECGESVEAVHLSDGATLPADLVIVGIGAVPSTDWLEGSGLTVTDGVMCDASLNAGAEGVYAAGDVARWLNPFYGTPCREEHWTNAMLQGIHAAKNLLRPDEATPYESVPYVWSDQFGKRIESVGRSAGADVHVAHGTLASGRFVALFQEQGIITGAVGMDWPTMVGRYRRLVRQRVPWEDVLQFARSQE